MSTDREVTRIVRSWLEEGAMSLPDRVLDAVLDQVPATPQRRPWRSAWRYADVNNTLKVALGAAAVLVVAVLAVNLLPQGGGPGGVVASPSVAAPSATASPTPAPSVVSPSPSPAGLAEGPHPLWEGPPAMTATIAAPGWFGFPGDRLLVKDDNPGPPAGAGLIVFTGDLYVYGDPCKWSGTEPASPATTAADLVTALASQALRDASEPVDITLDGYAGKAITLHVPDDAVFSDCDRSTFGSWTISTADGPGLDPYRYAQGPGQIDEIWALDVDGVLTVIDWSHYADTPAEDLAELQAIAESITFGP